MISKRPPLRIFFRFWSVLTSLPFRCSAEFVRNVERPPVGFFAWNINCDVLIDWSWSVIGSQEPFIGWLVSGCFEPSQPQRIMLGLKTKFSLSPSYSLYKPFYHTSLFLKAQLRLYHNSEWHIFWILVAVRGHSAWYGNLHQLSVTMSRVTYFVLRTHTGTDVSHSQTQENIRRGFGKMQVNWPEG